MNVIAQHLAYAIGLGGCDRKTSSEAERARCAVTKRLKQAIQKIADAIPTLGHHLTVRIKTGYFCSYNPHPDRPVVWKFWFRRIIGDCDAKSHSVTRKVTPYPILS